MSGKKFRKRMFGYKRADVFDYIRELDSQYAEDMQDKAAEIAKLSAEKDALAEKYDELQSKREIIVSVLEKAHIEAAQIVSDAKTEAQNMKEEASKEILQMKNDAEAEIEDKKAEANREIELKRRALRNMYEEESRRINSLRGEVVELRANSLEAIKEFERELYDIEQKLGYRGRTTIEAIGDLRRGGRVEAFKDVKIPIKVIRRKTDKAM